MSNNYDYEANRMNAFLVNMVRELLLDKKSVYYIDQNRDRRAAISAITRDHFRLEVTNGALSGKGSLHYNVLIVINEHEVSESLRKEWDSIPSFYNGIHPCTIRISI